MSSVDWRYLAYSSAALISTYASLMAIFSISLAIYHWGCFLPKLKKKVYKNTDYISSDEDTGGKLKQIAKKYSNVLEPSQDDTQEEESDLEKTQEEADPRKSLVTTTPRNSKLKKKSSLTNLTAKSDTSVVVSRRHEREFLLQKTQEED